MDFNFQEVEKKWRQNWTKNNTYKVEIDQTKPKCYVLDMFPYPSGAGLHVGHPLGYIASDIYSRFKRLNGFNVLHPMGYDSFGLPTEQYAIQTGQHPKDTTVKNIERYREQLDQIGFSFDWSREVRTSDPKYYKWTQWIFTLLFNAYYDYNEKTAKEISHLVDHFATKGSQELNVACGEEMNFSADDWNSFDEKKQQEILLNYRLAFLSETTVNWCPALGTVLANDEVKEGVSERGGHPVERKLMKQWSLRITAYADRLLEGLEKVDWSDSIKESQRNWIGKSTGAAVEFTVQNSDVKIPVFTTRPDTIFGVSFMVVAPESEWVDKITTESQKSAVEEYVNKAKNRSERERMADVKTVTGVDSGAFAIHPFTNEPIPIWIGDYVLASYGTGAVMAVAAHDSRDYAFAKTFNLSILPVVKGGDIEKEAYEAKSGEIINSDFINGMDVKEAIYEVIKRLEQKGIGKAQINFRLRDAIFSRQRYWGEPFPIIYKEDTPYLMDEEMPLVLPEVDKFLPTEEGEPPLARAENWQDANGNRYEYNTMPGWAGSSWYFLRYMDPNNDQVFASKEALDYWGNVDLYIGGSEHATGHLLYSRFWTKVLFDLGYIKVDEPFQKMINQGMILGTSEFAKKLINVKTASLNINGQKVSLPDDAQDVFVSDDIELDEMMLSRLNVNFVDNGSVDIEGLTSEDRIFANSCFVAKQGVYFKGQWYDFKRNPIDKPDYEFKTSKQEVEKMSKSKFNVVNPNDIISNYGADALRLYEMFLGPLEQYKPWSTKGIEGVSKFIRKYWNLHHNNEGAWNVSEEAATKEELKVLHRTIKKVEDDINNFSFNTSVSAFMVCVNDLQALKCNKKEILEPLAIVLHAYAPFVTEEIWEKLGHADSILNATYPKYDASVMVENDFTYPISFNGKKRFELSLPVTMAKDEIEKIVLDHEMSAKWMEGKTPKKVIVVPKKIVNIVI